MPSPPPSSPLPIKNFLYVTSRNASLPGACVPMRLPLPPPLIISTKPPCHEQSTNACLPGAEETQRHHYALTQQHGRPSHHHDDMNTTNFPADNKEHIQSPAELQPTSDRSLRRNANKRHRVSNLHSFRIYPLHRPVSRQRRHAVSTACTVLRQHRPSKSSVTNPSTKHTDNRESKLILHTMSRATKGMSVPKYQG